MTITSYRQPTSSSLTIRGEDPFENWRIMKDVHLVYARDVTEESDIVKTFLHECSRYRSSFDMDHALELLKRFNLDEKKPINKLSAGMQAFDDVQDEFACQEALFDNEFC